MFLPTMSMTMSEAFASAGDRLWPAGAVHDFVAVQLLGRVCGVLPLSLHSAKQAAFIGPMHENLLPLAAEFASCSFPACSPCELGAILLRNVRFCWLFSCFLALREVPTSTEMYREVPRSGECARSVFPRCYAGDVTVAKFWVLFVGAFSRQLHIRLAHSSHATITCPSRFFLETGTRMVSGQTFRRTMPPENSSVEKLLVLGPIDHFFLLYFPSGVFVFAGFVGLSRRPGRRLPRTGTLYYTFTPNQLLDIRVKCSPEGSGCCLRTHR